MSNFFTNLFKDSTKTDEYRTVLNDAEVVTVLIETLIQRYNSFDVPQQTREKLYTKYGISYFKDFDPNKKVWPHRSRAIKALRLLKEQIGLVDFQEVKPSEVKRLYNLLTQEIPQEVERHVHYAFTQGRESNNAKILATLVNIHIETLNTLPRKELNIINQNVNTTDTLTPERLTFPDYSFVEETRLNLVLSNLDEKWHTLHTKDFSYDVEEEYMIRNISQTYLPDILNLYRKALHTPQEAEALQLTMKQVNLLSEQIDYILSKHAKNVLSKMIIHTDFLTQKNKTIYEQEDE